MLFCLIIGHSKAQLQIIKNKKKLGITYNGKQIVPAGYDSLIGFNSNVCMLCVRKPMPSTNKFIRTLVPTMVCSYFNSKGERLVLKVNEKDTTSCFALSKNALEDFTKFGSMFKTFYNQKKYLVDFDFVQKTYKPYDNVFPFGIFEYYVIEKKTNGMSVFGLTDKNEQIIIEPVYANLKLNTFDSSIIACVAGLIGSSADDVFDLKGTKIKSYNRHVEFIDKYFSAFKIYQPKEYFIISDNTTKKETQLKVEAIMPFDSTCVLTLEDEKWFKFNLKNNEKKFYKLYEKDQSSH
jgi:hypothetical protein